MYEYTEWIINNFCSQELKCMNFRSFRSNRRIFSTPLEQATPLLQVNNIWSWLHANVPRLWWGYLKFKWLLTKFFNPIWSYPVAHIRIVETIGIYNHFNWIMLLPSDINFFKRYLLVYQQLKINFSAGFLTEYLRGAPLSACVACGNYAANLILRRFGVVMPAGPPTFCCWQRNEKCLNGNGTSNWKGKSSWCILVRSLCLLLNLHSQHNTTSTLASFESACFFLVSFIVI